MGAVIVWTGACAGCFVFIVLWRLVLRVVL